ncbi:glycosyltransferase family 4 protein [Cytobacillus kochii]|uniref:Glycosyl transferase n=1 Tax=Cytobacillus kochii TaxID=859143 RepID=A0A248TNM6_9BACI|nr:glycosyltransferase family 4 protein [Cytobacillus kochii]ASV69834.1 hypothetical protein CKF48_22490 [Cytobacillus kochii]
MKILLATYWAIPHLGGVWNYMIQLRKGLEAQGHEVDLMGFNTQNRHVIIINKDISIPITTFPHTELPPDELIVKYTAYQSKEYEKAAAQMDLEAYHIIHAQDVIAARAIDHLKLKHPALITTIHGSLTKEIKEQFFQDPSSKLENLSYFKNLEYIGGMAGYTTIVANEWMKNILCNDIHIESHQLTVLHYGFDIDDFLLRAAKPANHIRKRKKRQKLFIYTGRLIKAKGVQYLITALSYLKEQNNDWVCWIIGDGEEKQHLQKLTNDYHLRNQILFLGERNDVPSLLQQADLFILPTLSENQPLSIIEAQLSGLAIIASDVGGIPEMIEDGVTGFITPIGDSKKLAEKMAFLLHEDMVRRSIGTKAFEFATSHWSLANAIKLVLPLYHQAIQKKQMNN